jgi:hypothetical protein
MLKKPIAWTLIVALLATGCAHNPFDYGLRTIVEYKPGDSPETTNTPYKATYALYLRPKPSQVKEPPLYEQVLACSDKIGFEKGDNGKIIAIAGNERIPVDDALYCWLSTSEPEFEGFDYVCHQTCKNGATIVALSLWPVGIGFMVLFGAVAVPVLLGTYMWNLVPSSPGEEPHSQPQVSNDLAK